MGEPLALTAYFFAGLGWQPFGLQGVGMLAFSTLLFGVAQFMMIEALRQAEAVLVVLFRYSAVLWATLLGALFWGHYPDRWMVMGAILVVSSGLFIWHREVVRNRAGAARSLQQRAR